MLTPQRLLVRESDQGIAADSQFRRALPQNDFHRAWLYAAATKQLVWQSHFHAPILVEVGESHLLGKDIRCRIQPGQSTPSLTSHAAVQVDAFFV